jgi:tetratricopeptide (TPR) repeat protein
MTKQFVLLTATFLVTLSPARAANIKYLDKATGKEALLNGVTIIKSGPEGITVKAAGKERIVSALDVRDVLYNEDEVKPLDFQTYRVPFGKLDRANLPSTKEADRPKLYKEALTAFAELLANPKLPPRSKIREHVEFKAAETVARLAQTDPARQDAAVAALDKFRQAHPESWQVAPALMMLARIQEDKGDTKAVQQTYETLAAVPGISPEIRATTLLSVARLLIKTNDFAGAEAKLLDLKKTLPPDSAYLSKVRVYLAQCQALGDDAAKAAAAEKQLHELLTSSKDPAVLALVHNTLGDYYTKKNQPEDAFWEYLRVDMLYNGDRHEHARALYNLARLFREYRKDPDRADKCLETLKDKRFAGLEFQKKTPEK